jgi:flagellar biosynthesis protein FlhA
MMQAIRQFFGKNADLALVALVMGVLLVLFAPIPAGLLDFLILTNFGFALLILLVTFYAPRPVDFSTFPAILLVATLFRLSLNVSATRLILSEGQAGHVIGAVGSYVVGGNYVIGLIVFLILIVVQYVVVTNGAQRVSEVAARFTLDSMPGQQMSIDADLNMGFIDQAEAKKRRRNLEREAAFYGAMDGASKFVKGDAIAGIIIMLINVIGGLVIGVLQMGMSWGDALRHFTLLTIGDGIVTQVPALVVSVGTGLIVTRSASDAMLGLEVFKQITAYPKTLVLVGIALLGIAFLPGMPVIPPVILAMALAALYMIASKRAKASTEENAENPKDQEGSEADKDLTQVEPIEMLLGSGLAKMFDTAERTTLLERVGEFRKQFGTDMGLVLPKVKFKDSPSAQPNQYEVALFGDVVATGTLTPGHLLAIHPSGNTTLIQGTETKDPSYGLPALWIDPSQREAARAAKYTLVDTTTVLVTHLSETLRLQAANLLTRTEVDRMLSRLRTAQPGLVEELVPTQLSVGDVQKVLQGLVREKVPIRNLQAIVETLIDASRAGKDVGLLIEHCRQRLSTTICNALSPDKKVLHVLTLHPEVEGQLLHVLTQSSSAEGQRPASMDPRIAEAMILKLAQQAERMVKSSLTPVLLCPVELRRHIRAMSERAIPHLRVLSTAEIPMQFELRAFASVGA